MKSHLDTECPCYCPYCDVTAEREIISREHKETCHKFPATHTNNINIGMNDVQQDKNNKSQRQIILNEMLNPNMVVELREAISTMREEVTQSVQITKEHSEKNDKQNDTTMLNQLYNIIIYFAVALLVIASVVITVLMAISLQLNSLKNRLDEDTKMHKQNFIELQQQNALLQKVLDKTIADLHSYHQLSSSVWSRLSAEFSNRVAPVIVKMPLFTKKVMDKEGWDSSPFFAFEKGYQMYLKINAGGIGNSEGTHVSVYLGLMKGPYDDKLEQSSHWPLRGIFTTELLNQLDDSDHYSRMVQFHHYRCSECTNRVLEGSNATPFGHSQFISHDTILHHSNNSYHKSDYLVFRITYEDMDTPFQVTPVTFKVTKFSYWLKNTKDLYISPPFFAYKGGYQMHLKVFAAGNYNGEGTHVSVYIGLMKGPHDDKLE